MTADTSTITLYDYELSGNCYKARLFMSILGVKYQRHDTNFYPGREFESDWFLELNPLGTLPVMTVGALTLKDSAAILVYLAGQFDKQNTWYPTDQSARLAQVSEWLAFADGLTASASAARLVEGFFYDFDADAARNRAHRLLRILDEHLWFAERDDQLWLVSGDSPTIADIACFPYVILSEEGSISRQSYPAIRRWTDRVKRIPGFIGMPGIFPAGPALPDNINKQTVSDQA